VNEEHISVNSKLLYEKHQELNERLQSEVHRNSLGIAEIKGILQVHHQVPQRTRNKKNPRWY